ncbi:hypothetical protein WJX73_009243 [Symbiochloris irregularis]|uniref:F-box domain-containing protein n=1 Tax=Symbiochloris irregularis TaxID=706552 RepID=A0AAW1NYX1_9CHLO
MAHRSPAEPPLRHSRAWAASAQSHRQHHADDSAPRQQGHPPTPSWAAGPQNWEAEEAGRDVQRLSLYPPQAQYLSPPAFWPQHAWGNFILSPTAALVSHVPGHSPSAPWFPFTDARQADGDWTQPGFSQYGTAYSQPAAFQLISGFSALPSGFEAPQQCVSQVYVPTASPAQQQHSFHPSNFRTHCPRGTAQYQHRHPSARPSPSAAHPPAAPRGQLPSKVIAGRPSKASASAAAKAQAEPLAESAQAAAAAVQRRNSLLSSPGAPAHYQSDSDSDSDDPDEVAERVKARELQSGGAPEVCDTWDWLPEGFLRDVVNHLDLASAGNFRLTCARWRIVADRNVERLHLSKAKVHNVVAQFPCVRDIDMSGCQNVRNRNVTILARSSLRLRSLCIGHASTMAYGKPRITNQALASVAELKSLRMLCLGDCGAITNNGMAVLASLTSLTSLAVLRCPRIADKGLSILTSLNLLEHLDVSGCVKVTDATLQLAAAVPSLRSLHTAYTRISGAGIRRLAAATNLTSLRFHAEDIPDFALAALTGLTNLQELWVPQCYNLSGNGVLAATRGLSMLQSLNLRGAPLTEEHLSSLVTMLPGLTHLQVRGIELGPKAMRLLAKLSKLESLTLDACTLGLQPEQCTVLSSLTRLHMLEVHRVRGRAHVLGPIAALPNLTHLHLADCPFDRESLCFALENQQVLLPQLPEHPNLQFLSLAHFPLAPRMMLRIV